MDLNFFIPRSLTRVIWCEFSARLFAHLSVIWRVNGKCILRGAR